MFSAGRESSPEMKSHGKFGTLHYPCILLLRKDDLHPRRIQGYLPIEGRQRGEDLRALSAREK